MSLAFSALKSNVSARMLRSVALESMSGKVHVVPRFAEPFKKKEGKKQTEREERKKEVVRCSIEKDFVGCGSSVLGS